MQPKLTATHSSSGTFDGKIIKVIGESFDLPIAKSERNQMHTQIRFETETGIQLNKTRYFREELSEADLKKNVEHYAQNLKEIL